MFYQHLGHQRLIDNLKNTYINFPTSEETDEGSIGLQKADELGILGFDPDDFEKGRPAMPIGAHATWNGIDYLKTARGWRPAGKHRGQVKEHHDHLHKNEEKDKDHHAMMLDAGKMDHEEWVKKHGSTLHSKYKAVHDYLHKDKIERQKKEAPKAEEKPAPAETKPEAKKEENNDPKSLPFEEKLKRAEKLGYEAFDKEIKAPIHDKDLLGLSHEPYKAEGIKLMEAWNKGKQKASLEAGKKDEPTPEEKPKVEAKPIDKKDYYKTGAKSNEESKKDAESAEVKKFGEELKAGDEVVVYPDRPDMGVKGKVVESHGVNGVKVDTGSGSGSVYHRNEVMSKEKHDKENPLGTISPDGKYKKTANGWEYIKEEKEAKADEVETKKEGFTESVDLNRIYAEVKTKYGDKKGAAIYEVANRLVNPNKNTIVSIKQNGVTVKEGDKYLFKPFGNTDSNMKKWVLYKDMDVTDQFSSSVSKPEPAKEAPKEEKKTGSDLYHIKGDKGHVSVHVFHDTGDDKFGVDISNHTKNEDGTERIQKKPRAFIPNSDKEKFLDDLKKRGGELKGAEKEEAKPEPKAEEKKEGSGFIELTGKETKADLVKLIVATKPYFERSNSERESEHYYKSDSKPELLKKIKVLNANKAGGGDGRNVSDYDNPEAHSHKQEVDKRLEEYLKTKGVTKENINEHIPREVGSKIMADWKEYFTKEHDGFVGHTKEEKDKAFNKMKELFDNVLPASSNKEDFSHLKKLPPKQLEKHKDIVQQQIEMLGKQHGMKQSDVDKYPDNIKRAYNQLVSRREAIDNEIAGRRAF